MFEGKPLRPSEARPLDDEHWDGGSLRPLSWGDLVARLSEVRDLRGSPVPFDESGDASFDASSARRIAAHHNGKQDVNPDVSGNGKAPAGTALHTVHGAHQSAMRK